MNFDSAHLEIRPLDAGDFDQILALVEIVEEAPHWSRAQFEELLAGENLAADARSRSRIALVVRDARGIARDGEIAGFAVASVVAAEAELESIAVAERARRHGVGRLLLESLVTRLRALGTRELHLEVRASNQAALAFYRTRNFKQSGIRPRYYADPEEDAVLMARRLD